MAHLIQLHYHNRQGGVTQVMQSYANAFLEIFPSSHTTVLCSNERANSGSPTNSFVNFPQFDYMQVVTPEEYFGLRDSIETQVTAYFSSLPADEPLYIIAHNLNLAKNCALTSAVVRSMKKLLSLNYQLKLFWVIHDLFEDNRPNLLREVLMLEDWGIPIREDLYPVGAWLFITPGIHHHKLFKTRGIKTVHLYDPLKRVIPAISLTQCNRKQAVVHELAKRGLFVGDFKKVFIYPVRCIARKNIVEAILLATIYFDGILLLGSMGTSEYDTLANKKIVALTEELKLPVLFDIENIFSECLGNSDASLIEQFSNYCDSVISSSVEEGFGYSYFEPWLYGKMVIARKPIGFEFPEAMNLSTFYSELRLPKFNRDSTISSKQRIDDFSVLPLKCQLEILKDCNNSKKYRQTILSKIQKELPIPSDYTILQEIIDRNSQQVQKSMEWDSFVEGFKLVIMAGKSHFIQNTFQYL